MYTNFLQEVLYGLLLGMYAIGGSVLEGNVSWDLKMIFAIKCPLHGGFVRRV